MELDVEFQSLAEELKAVCRTAIGSESVAVRKSGETVWDYGLEEPWENPYGGVIVGCDRFFHLFEEYRGRLFGVRWLPDLKRRRPLVSFGFRDIFDFPRLSGPFTCEVADKRVIAGVRPLVERFANSHGLTLRFHAPE